MQTINSLNSAVDLFFPTDQFDQWPKKLEYQLNLGITDAEVRVYRAFMQVLTGSDFLSKTQIQQARDVAYKYIDKDIENYNDLFYDQFIDDMKHAINTDQAETDGVGNKPMGYGPVLEAFSTGYQFGFTQMVRHVSNEYMDFNRTQFSDNKLKEIQAAAFDYTDQQWNHVWKDGFAQIAVLKNLLGVF